MPATPRQWDDYPAIASNQKWSLHAITRLQKALAGHLHGVVTVAVSGSLARLDANEHSDVDLIIVLKDDLAHHIDDQQAIAKVIYDAATSCGINAPKAKGIYATPTTSLALTDPNSLGKVNEDMIVFGHRMQLLIESRPLSHEAGYQELIALLLSRYLQPLPVGSASHSTAYLLNDLIRYYRSYLVAKLWDVHAGPDAWCLKQIKVRHSRLVSFASTLLSIAEGTTTPVMDPVALQNRLRLRPLDRIAHLFELHHADATPIFDAYDRFLQAMADPSFREELIQQSATPLNSRPDGRFARYQELVENGEQIACTLMRFLLEYFHEHASAFLQRVVF